MATVAQLSSVQLTTHVAAKDDQLEIVRGVASCAIQPSRPKSRPFIRRRSSELDTNSTSISRTLEPRGTHLISSPYSDFANQLDLRTLDVPLLFFAFALAVLEPVRLDYATAPYLECFNWPTVFAHLRSFCAQSGLQWERRELYVVIFRSRLKQNIDRGRLGQLDQESHREACESGGLLKYWFGSCDAEQRNLATCMLLKHNGLHIQR